MDFEDLFNQEDMGLHTNSKKFSLKNSTSFETDDGIFDSEKRTIIDPVRGLVTEETTSLYTLDCGHVAHDPKELLGLCQKCGVSYVCLRCQVRCERCLFLLCTTCIKMFGGAPYCGTCRPATFAKKSLLYIGGKIHEALSKPI